MARVGVIDIGTVSARLGIAEVEAGRVQAMVRTANVCDLGQDVDATGRLRDDAIARTLEVAGGYVAVLRRHGVRAVSCTLTSAARDAENGSELMDGLVALGLRPQVIPGSVEGALAFRGAAQFMEAHTVMVADSGGGSTELTCGRIVDGHSDVAWVHSFDVGCRRVTERFLPGVGPATEEQLEAARVWCREQFSSLMPWDADGRARHYGDLVGCDRPEELVVTGGTVTTLAAMELELDPYDDGVVQGYRLSRAQVSAAEERLAALSVADRCAITGIQPRRAPVILGGAVLVGQLMDAGGFDSLTVSVYDGLEGLALAVSAALQGFQGPLGWAPELSDPTGQPS